MLAGLDIGGTKIAYAIADEGSETVRGHLRRPTAATADADADLLRMAEDLRGLLAEHGTAPESLSALGVSAAGPLDRENGTLLQPPNLPWERAEVVGVLSEALGCRVVLENDANAAALAEWHYGAGRGTRDMVFLTMSTGVGGGLILGGRLHHGVGCAAGEVGHVPVEWNGARCACGQRGCLEAYIGGASWARRLAEITPPDSRVAALTPAGETPRPEQVVAAAREGCAFARAEMDRFNDYLARGIVGLAFTLAPEKIVLGTIARAAGEELCLAPVREQVAAHLWPVIAEGLTIEAGSLGDAIADYAGLSVAREGLAETRG